MSELRLLITDELRHQYKFLQRFKLNLGIHCIFDNPYSEASENQEIRPRIDSELDRYIWLHSREFDEGTYCFVFVLVFSFLGFTCFIIFVILYILLLRF